jgi:magnesium transporter
LKKNKLSDILSELQAFLNNDEFTSAQKLFDTLRPADSADLVQGLEMTDQVVLLSQLSATESADVLGEMEDDKAAEVAEQLSAERLANILDEMETDEAADVLGDISQEKASETLREMEDPGDVVSLMRYPDDTAGGLMTPAVITLNQSWTIEEALAKLRELGPDAESTYYLFVLDENDRLIGVIGLRDLVTSPTNIRIIELMKSDVVSVLVTTDQEECARTLSRYGYMVLPVVDENGCLLGVITADDLIEVAEDEATEDMYRMVGITGEEKVFGSVKESIIKRLPWLAINILTLLIAITVVDFFEEAIAGMVALAVFLPLVSAEGGNAGSQTATVFVRGISLGELAPSDGKRYLLKELRIAVANGAIIGLGTAVITYIWKGDWRISAGILLAMILNFLMAATTGVLIPLGLKKLDVDPALASAAFVTGFTDTFGFLFFLGIVSLLASYI